MPPDELPFADAPPPSEEENIKTPQLDDEPPVPHSVQAPVPSPSGISMGRVFDLVFALGRSHPSVGEASRFDPGMAFVLWFLLGRAHELTAENEAIRVTQAAIAREANLSIKQVRARLGLLAAFGLIAVVSDQDAGSGFCAVGNVFFNPLMVQLVLKKGGRKLGRQAIDPFLAMGLARDLRLKRPQGWMGFDVEYGEREPAPGTPAAAGHQMAPWAQALGDELGALEEAAASVSAISVSKSMRAQERMRRAALAEDFVRGCAKVWQAAHERRGFGAGPPAWVGPFDGLSPSNKQQFNELKKLFERGGGAQVAMAWACFVNYQPFTDSNGKLKFDPTLPHVQWVSSDKKPSHFAKHFDAVLMDPEVRRISGDQGTRDRIAAEIGRAFDAPPAPPIQVAAKKGWQG